MFWEMTASTNSVCYPVSAYASAECSERVRMLRAGPFLCKDQSLVLVCPGHPACLSFGCVFLVWRCRAGVLSASPSRGGEVAMDGAAEASGRRFSSWSLPR